jgi:hypothetical protein
MAANQPGEGGINMERTFEVGDIVSAYGRYGIVIDSELNNSGLVVVYRYWYSPTPPFEGAGGWRNNWWAPECVRTISPASNSGDNKNKKTKKNDDEVEEEVVEEQEERV